jgi:hypothetical protein
MKMDDRDRKDDHGSQSDRDQAEIVWKWRKPKDRSW